MTDNSKENLLKLLLNKPNESQNENIPTYSNPIRYENNLATRSADYFDNPMQVTPYKVIEKDGIYIAYNYQSRILIKLGEDEILTTNIGTLNEKIIDMYADDTGLYAIGILEGKVYLDYMKVAFTNGVLSLTFGQYYNITDMLKEVTGDSNPANSLYNGSLKLHKSPIDGRFLIATSLLNQNYFSVIEYTINVGSDNTYRYQRISKDTISTSFPIIDDMYVSWNDDNVNYAIGIIGTSSIVQSKSNFNLYEITGTMSNISSSQIAHLDNTICAPLYLKVSYTPQIRYRTLTDRYYSYSVVGSSTKTVDDVTWTSGEVVFARLNGTTRTELSRTATDYMISSQSSAYKNEFDIIIKNDNVFGIETILTAPNKIQATFKQLIKNTIHSKTVLSNIDYTRTGLGFSLVMNDYNLYKYAYQLDNTMYVISSVFRPTGYNGETYFSRDSITPESGQLYDITSKVVFARDLYNKSIVGDTINSTIHIPANKLNTNPIIKENLISKTNDIIDTADEEITKNEYEELYVSYIDTFKIWDKNNKSTYQQSASYELANQISNNFTMYVAKYRITYKDDTTYESDIGDIPIVNGEGVFDFLFGVPDIGAKSIEFYDQNFRSQFAMIDLSSFTPGAYRITEKIKIE